VNQSPTLALRDGDWKFLCNTDGAKAELYDLRRDSHETHNLINTQLKRATTMKKQLLQWHGTLPDAKPRMELR
jgi:uncharacterized sulfatase